jgi:hypothetical protein
MGCSTMAPQVAGAAIGAHLEMLRLLSGGASGASEILHDRAASASAALSGLRTRNAVRLTLGTAVFGETGSDLGATSRQTPIACTGPPLARAACSSPPRVC